MKPDPAIYRLCLERNGLDPAACIFVDDSAANVAGAAALGIDAIRFTDPRRSPPTLGAPRASSPQPDTA